MARRRVADRLITAVADLCGVSAGIAEWDGRETADELMARADAQLLTAKRLRS